METIYCDPSRDRGVMEARVAIAGSPEAFLFNLGRFPNVDIAKLTFSGSTPSDLKGKMQEVAADRGGMPLTWVLCHAGGYRSPTIAYYLVHQGLASLSKANQDYLPLGGSGRRDLDGGLSYSELGIFGHYKDRCPLDALIINASFKMSRREADKINLLRITLMLEQALESALKPQHRLSIIWLEGEEEEVKRYFGDRFDYLKDAWKGFRV